MAILISFLALAFIITLLRLVPIESCTEYTLRTDEARYIIHDKNDVVSIEKRASGDMKPLIRKFIERVNSSRDTKGYLRCEQASCYIISVSVSVHFTSF